MDPPFRHLLLLLETVKLVCSTQKADGKETIMNLRGGLIALKGKTGL
jgi:hypothetical protein